MIRKNVPVVFALVFLVLVFLFFANLIRSTSADSFQLANSLIAFGGLALAFFTTLVSYLNRIESQRQTLYEVQLHIYTKLYYLALRVVHEYASNPSNLKWRDAYKEFFDTARQNWLVLSKDVIKAVVAFEDSLTTENEEVKRFTNEKQKNEGLLAIGRANSKLLEVLRKSVGIEILHEETSRLLGVAKEPRKRLRRRS